MIRGFALVLFFVAGSVYAQSTVRTTDGSGAILRSLDRITGQVQDYELRNGEYFERGTINVNLRECRYPRRAIDRDAFAYLTIQNNKNQNTLFSGWMVASSPAIAALEHPRFDVWILRCLAPT